MNTPHHVTAAAAPITLPKEATVAKKATAAKKPKPARKARAKKATKAVAKKTKAAKAARPYERHGATAFEVRPWKDAAAVKARFAANPKLAKVYAALGPKGSAAKSLTQLAEKAFGNKPSVAKARSWVRNQMRYLRDSKLAKRVEAGAYQKVG